MLCFGFRKIPTCREHFVAGLPVAGRYSLRRTSKTIFSAGKMKPAPDSSERTAKRKLSQRQRKTAHHLREAARAKLLYFGFRKTPTCRGRRTFADTSSQSLPSNSMAQPTPNYEGNGKVHKTAHHLREISRAQGYTLSLV